MVILKKYNPLNTETGFRKYFLEAPKITHFEKFKLIDLIEHSNFYISSLFTRGGITFHKNLIVLESTFNSFHLYQKLCLIAHEAYHVAQQKEWGYPQFMTKYFGEFIKSGFSYDKMTKLNIEKAAYDYEALYKEYLFANFNKTLLIL